MDAKNEMQKQVRGKRIFLLLVVLSAVAQAALIAKFGWLAG